MKNKIIQLMTQEKIPPLCIEVFLSHYKKMLAGEESMILEQDIQAVAEVADMESFTDCSIKGQEALKQSVLIKLNGGLGTSMGLEKAKSLLEAKEKLSFLEIIVKQLISQRNNFNCALPIVFMNSFRTEADTCALLHNFPELLQGQKGIPFSFIQNKVPKILVDNKAPAQWPKDPATIWCPPGHGDIYTSLQTSGLLDQLLQQGIKYAFISNADNLGASMDLSILGYFAEQDISFMMEVADRTEADRKGGHLAQFANGRLLLRELAQCHTDDSESFQDIHKHKYFNTNNLWLRLDRLKEHLNIHKGIMDLPLIQNKKHLDPRDSSSPKVIQMETAMGSAISSFKDSIAIRISKTRFVPIKTTNELLGLWSNAFILDKDSLVKPNPNRKAHHIIINLDQNYFKTIDDLKARFPQGAPDLLKCQKLSISGDVKFGAEVKIIGNVTISNESENQLVIESGAILEGELKSL